MVKRKYGTGTVEKLRSGRFRFKLPPSLVGGQQKSSESFATREECEEVLAAAIYELTRGHVIPVGSVTLGLYGERHLQQLQSRSRRDDLSRWRHHVVGSEIAALPIGELRPKHIQRFMAQLAQTPKLASKRGGVRGARKVTDETISPQTQRHVFALLRRVLSAARVDELVAVNPCEALRAPKLDATKEGWTFLRLDEIKLLLGAAAIPLRTRLAYAVAIFTGMRKGELWGLRWGDVSLKPTAYECAVRRSYDGPTKSGKVRRFPLLPPAAAAFQELRRLAGDPDDQALVFVDEQANLSSKGWARLRQLVGIERHVRFHDLRHTCASHLVMGSWGDRWTLTEVRDYLAHSTVSVTERYAHLSPGHLHALAEKTPGYCGEQRSPQFHPAQDTPGGVPLLTSSLLSRGSQVRDLPGAPSLSCLRALWGIGFTYVL